MAKRRPQGERIQGREIVSEESEISTELTIREGKTVVVGKAGVRGVADAVFLIPRAHFDEREATAWSGTMPAASIGLRSLAKINVPRKRVQPWPVAGGAERELGLEEGVGCEGWSGWWRAHGRCRERMLRERVSCRCVRGGRRVVRRGWAAVWRASRTIVAQGGAGRCGRGRDAVAGP